MLDSHKIAKGAPDNWQMSVTNGLRFEFGKNWGRLLQVVTDAHVLEAERGLCQGLRTESLAGQTFLDVGSGSGIHSLAAQRLGATVVSFDFDPYSAECTRTLKARFAPTASNWTTLQGSVLDTEFINSMGTFDIVYSWGVLHHTGQMWPAISNIALLVNPGGKLFIAIYNDQGWMSKVWCFLKKLYNSLPGYLKPCMALGTLLALWGPQLVVETLRGCPGRKWRNYIKQRGMSPRIDVLDWIGGYPFEVAKPEEVLEYLRPLGFRLDWLQTQRGNYGCNQFVFVKEAAL